MKFGRVEYNQLRTALGDHGGTSRFSVDKGHLAEKVAGAECLHLITVDEAASVALDEQEELASDGTLLGQNPTIAQ